MLEKVPGAAPVKSHYLDARGRDKQAERAARHHENHREPCHDGSDGDYQCVCVCGRCLSIDGCLLCVCIVSRSGWCPWPCKAGLSGVIYLIPANPAGLAAASSSPGLWYCKSAQLQ